MAGSGRCPHLRHGMLVKDRRRIGCLAALQCRLTPLLLVGTLLLLRFPLPVGAGRGVLQPIELGIIGVGDEDSFVC